MSSGRWLDHLPAWLAWGAVATSGAWSPQELAVMAAPLLAAALVEARRGSLLRFRRLLEGAALGMFLFQVVSRSGVLPTVVHTLFILCAVRLCLPRALPQRRQLLLMGFLLYLTTAVSTSDLDFLAWGLAWAAGGGLVLMHLNWEASARLRQGPPPRPPYRRLPAMVLAAAALGTCCFVALPRLGSGARSLPLGARSAAGLRAGLTDVIDLSVQGPIEAGGEVALRVVPLGRDPAFAPAFGLLRGMVLEDLQGQRWEPARDTPRRPWLGWAAPPAPRAHAADLFLSPSPMGVVPVPYGRASLTPTEGEPLRSGAGASVRFIYPGGRIQALRLTLDPQEGEPERPPAGERLASLLGPGQGTDAALAWSLRAAPGDLPPDQLAERLGAALRSFRYTLDNPSGGARNPLQDFLERSRAGHCEYFASALAVMLRRRGVPARVAVGYRLGPWIEAGGYYLVTQREAHAWVEYYDPAVRGWRLADPTPAAPPSAYGSGTFLAAFARFADSVRFSWDRHVVRFSDEDQVAGMAWFEHQWQGLVQGPTRDFLRWAGLALGGVAGALALAFAWSRWRPAPSEAGPGRVPQLRPLLRAAGGLPPGAGETARAWLARLGAARPDRLAPLAALARETDAVTYGGKGGTALARLAREEAAAWRRPGPPPEAEARQEKSPGIQGAPH